MFADRPADQASLFELLHEGEELLFLQEPVKERFSELEGWYKSLGEFGDRMKKSDVGFEYAALQWRMQQQQHSLRGFSGIAIGERHPEVGAGYYLPALHTNGKITTFEFYEYMGWAVPCLKTMAWPQIWATIHTAARVCRQRISGDANRHEAEKLYNTEPYLEAIEFQIYENERTRLRLFTSEAGVEHPLPLRYNATTDLCIDPDSRRRYTEDIVRGIENIVLQQRQELERRRAVDSRSGGKIRGDGVVATVGN